MKTWVRFLEAVFKNWTWCYVSKSSAGERLAKTGRFLRLKTSQSILLQLQINGRVYLKNRDQHSRLMSGFYTHICSCICIYTSTHVLYTCVHTLEYTEDIRMIWRNLSYLLALFLLICHMEIKYREVMQNHEEVVHPKNDFSVVSKTVPSCQLCSWGAQSKYYLTFLVITVSALI